MAKWNSVANHIQNKHRHKDKLFPRCKHGRLTGRERKKKWLKPGGLRCIWTYLLHTVLDYHYYIHMNKSLWESAENNHLTWVLCDTCCLTVTVNCFQFWHTSRTSTTCRKQVPCLKMNRKHRKVLYWGRWAICECTRDVDHAWLISFFTSLFNHACN